MSGLSILVLAAYLPWHGHGGGVLASNLLRELGRRHTVTLLTYALSQEEPHVAEIAPHCQRVQVVMRKPYDQPDPGINVGPPEAGSASHRAMRQAWRRLPRPVRLTAHTVRRAACEWTNRSAQPLPDEIAACQTPAFADSLHAIVAGERFDVVIGEWPEMALYGLQGPAAAATVLDLWELRSRTYLTYVRTQSSLDEKVFWLVQWRKMLRLESFITGHYDLVTAVTDRDAQGLRRHNGQARILVNPVGLSLRDRPVSNELARWRDTLVFLGRMSYGPNQDAVEFFVDQIYPRVRAHVPHVRFLIVGGDPPKRILALAGRDGIDVTGYVPDTNRFLARGTVFVLPMRQGAGIKVKALEAMAAGIPIVTTPAGAEGLAARAGEHLLIERDPAGFAAATTRLLQDEALRQKLATAGRRLAQDRYDSAANVKELECAYEQIVQKRQSR